MRGINPSARLKLKAYKILVIYLYGKVCFMKTKELIGLILTALGLLLYIYTLIEGGMKGMVGVSGRVELTPILMALGMYAILIGPALWLGEVPVAVKKFIEAKTGRKLS